MLDHFISQLFSYLLTSSLYASTNRHGSASTVLVHLEKKNLPRMMLSDSGYPLSHYKLIIEIVQNVLGEYLTRPLTFLS